MKTTARPAASSPKTANETYRYSERAVLRNGEFFKVSGGTEYRGTRMGVRGVFMFQRVVKRKGTRVWIRAVQFVSGQFGGTFDLLVEGRAYKHPVVPGLKLKPYRIRKLTPRSVRKLAGGSKLKERKAAKQKT